MLALAIGSLLHVLFGTSEPYATQLVMAVIVTIGAITLGRIVLRYFLHTLTTTRVLVVGAGTTADRIMLSVRQDPGMTLVGRIVDGDVADAGALGRWPTCPGCAGTSTCTGSSWPPATSSPSRRMDIYRELQDFVHIAMVPRYYELISWRSRLTDLAGHALPRDRPAAPEPLGQVHEAGLRPVHQLGRARCSPHRSCSWWPSA